MLEAKPSTTTISATSGLWTWRPGGLKAVPRSLTQDGVPSSVSLHYLTLFRVPEKAQHWEEIQAAEGPRGRANHTSACAAGQLLVFGGYDGPWAQPERFYAAKSSSLPKPRILCDAEVETAPWVTSGLLTSRRAQGECLGELWMEWGGLCVILYVVFGLCLA